MAWQQHQQYQHRHTTLVPFMEPVDAALADQVSREISIFLSARERAVSNGTSRTLTHHFESHHYSICFSHLTFFDGLHSTTLLHLLRVSLDLDGSFARPARDSFADVATVSTLGGTNEVSSFYLLSRSVGDLGFVFVNAFDDSNPKGSGLLDAQRLALRIGFVGIFFRLLGAVSKFR